MVESDQYPSEREGLTATEAAKRLEEEGYNELPSSKPRGIFAIACEIVREPMFLLLIACGIIYLILGNAEEALMLLGFVFFVIGITLYQERRTEHTLDALKDLSSPRALVIRDRQQLRIPGREVVRGDLVVLTEGDRVPADGVLISAMSLSVDESLLTGESVPVRKSGCADTSKMERPGGDDLPFIYSGTLIVQGQGIACVLSIGQETEIGRIGKALRILEPTETPLKIEISRLVRKLALIGATLCSLVVVVYGITRDNWLGGLLAGITMAMSILPEEFPVILTIFLALGAWRIANNHVLTRRVPALEALGAATVLCVDKTGTLTLNRMSVNRIFTRGEFCEVSEQKEKIPPDIYHELVEFSILASQRDPFDPMEKAIKEFGANYLAGTGHLHQDWQLIREYPLSRDLLAMSHVWQSPTGNDFVIAAKGAPEVIADLSHFDEAHLHQLSLAVSAMADDGLRVIGVGRASFNKSALPPGQHDFNFEFLGLIGLADPVRPGVSAALKECNEAGIRVVMITGDYPGTARSIARQIGLTSSENVITGPELDLLSDEELQVRIARINIFARVVPEQKLRLVSAFKANGEIVAMTGDGVNDAPALKSAHIGIAMGGRGTDVAREAADLVLVDDDFLSIVQAVKLGRRIFDNIKKAIAYTIAIHVPIAGMSFLPVMFGWPLVLLPVHIVFLEMIIDPACSIVFEAEQEEDNVMRRPPRDPGSPLFGRKTIIISAAQGLVVLVLLLVIFGLAMHHGRGEQEARALTFTTLIIANLSLIFANRSWSRLISQTLRTPNKALWWVTGGALGFLLVVINTPFLYKLLHMSKLHPLDMLLCLTAGIGSILWFEGYKLVSRTRTP